MPSIIYCCFYFEKKVKYKILNTEKFKGTLVLNWPLVCIFLYFISLFLITRTFYDLLFYHNWTLL